MYRLYETIWERLFHVRRQTSESTQTEDLAELDTQDNRRASIGELRDAVNAVKNFINEVDKSKLEAVLRTDLFVQLLEISKHEDFEVAQTATDALKHMIRHLEYYPTLVIHDNIVKYIVNVIEAESTDEDLLAAVLKTLGEAASSLQDDTHLIIYKCVGSSMHRLLAHKNATIAQNMIIIIERQVKNTSVWQMLLDGGLLDILIRVLQSEDEVMLISALAIVSYITLDKQKAHTKALANKGFLQQAVKILKHSNHPIAPTTLNVIRNMSEIHNHIKLDVLNAGIIPICINLSCGKDIGTVRNSLLLINELGFEECFRNALISHGILCQMNNLLQSTDDVVILMAIGMLSKILVNDRRQIDAVVDLGLYPLVVQLLSKTDEPILAFALNTIIVLVSNDNNRHKLVGFGVLQHMERILSSPSEKVVRRAITFLNLLIKKRTTTLQKDIVLAGLLPQLMSLLGAENEDIVKTSLAVLCKLGRTSHHRQLMNQLNILGHLEPLKHNGDRKVRRAASDLIFLLRGFSCVIS